MQAEVIAQGIIMPDIFTIFAHYFWLIALVLCFINAVAYQRRFQSIIAEHPERARGYQQLLIGFVAVQSVVWLVMGIGIVLGGVPNIFAYFNPATGNPYVLVWHGVLITLWVIGAIWMFFLGGAQFIVDHPGLLNFTVAKPVLVQLWYCMCILGGVLGEIFMWTQGSAITFP
jgi:hypothetical protein